jgi:sterol 3beta-glucosyltransferase
MRLLLVSYGTEGDTRPLAMLADGLQQAGHQVHLLAERTTLSSAAALGVPHSALAGEIESEVDALVGQGNNLRAASRGLARMAERLSGQWLAQTEAAARGCDAILAGGLIAFIAMSVAQRLRLPLIGVGTVPVTPTRAFPSTFLPPGPWPRWLNRPSHVLAANQIWRQFRSPLNQARQQHGLAPLRSPRTDMPFLYGFSPTLLPAPADWAANQRVCGQWRLPDDNQQLPEDLSHWLASHDAPVFIGFGSMRGFDRHAVFGGLIRALGDRPILLSPGWAGLPDALSLPDHVRILEAVPHEALFPHCALLIHHGGSGTTHSASRAGVPQLVLPLAADQPFWAQRVFELGIAGPPLSQRRLDHASLRAAIATATTPRTAGAAIALGRRMANEDGVATAVTILERWITGAARTSAL